MMAKIKIKIDGNKNKMVKIKLTTESINKHVDKYTRSVINHLYENHYKHNTTNSCGQFGKIICQR